MNCLFSLYLCFSFSSFWHGDFRRISLFRHLLKKKINKSQILRNWYLAIYKYAFKALENRNIWSSLSLEWGSPWDDYPDTVGLSYISSSFNEWSQKYDFRRMTCQSYWHRAMKKRWVLSPTESLCSWRQAMYHIYFFKIIFVDILVIIAGKMLLLSGSEGCGVGLIQRGGLLRCSSN